MISRKHKQLVGALLSKDSARWTESEREAFERICSEFPDAGRELRALASLTAKLRSLPEPSVDPAYFGSFLPRLNAKLEKGERISESRLSLPVLLRTAASLAVVFLMIWSQTNGRFTSPREERTLGSIVENASYQDLYEMFRASKSSAGMTAETEAEFAELVVPDMRDELLLSDVNLTDTRAAERYAFVPYYYPTEFEFLQNGSLESSTSNDLNERSGR